MIRRRQNTIFGRGAWMVFIMVLLSLNGCGASGATPPVKMIARQVQVDQFTIVFEAPERPQLLTEQEVLITLTDPQGQPVEGAEVWLALIMPTMQMSPNEPDATAEGGGRYRAKTLFTMSGTWKIEVHVTVQGKEHIATFHTST